MISIKQHQQLEYTATVRGKFCGELSVLLEGFRAALQPCLGKVLLMAGTMLPLADKLATRNTGSPGSGLNGSQSLGLLVDLVAKNTCPWSIFV